MEKDSGGTLSKLFESLGGERLGKPQGWVLNSHVTTQEKIEWLLKEESIVSLHGIRVYFVGNLKLLNKPVRLAVEKVMASNDSLPITPRLCSSSAWPILPQMRSSMLFKNLTKRKFEI
ncbi:hypothetical protein HHK36_028247 [Tetracentron sinense]|uniref:Uncharacterized protein n=1 Tax=Tetracentron sinense TaxID=13715 RepID=A0A835D1X6_TETSI|nr:hypothetical protein HHK36_028247 [Tetracentron sinense]